MYLVYCTRPHVYEAETLVRREVATTKQDTTTHGDAEKDVETCKVRNVLRLTKLAFITLYIIIYSTTVVLLYCTYTPL